MATQRLVPYQLTNPLLQSVIPGGRLTVSSGLPLTITDVTGATTIYYTPYLHNVVTLWDGTTWLAVTFSEVSLALGTLTTAMPYDVFGFLSSGALSTELLTWIAPTARSTTITLQDGRYCKTGDKTRLYLGTFYTTSTTTTEDSEAKRDVWNMYNRSARRLFKATAAGTHTYNGNYRQWNASAANQIEFVSGLALDDMPISILGALNPPIGVYASVGFALDATTTDDTELNIESSAGSVDSILAVAGVIAPQIGWHFVPINESTYTSGTATFGQAKMQGTVLG